jgi:hypothetical protein
MSSFFSSPRFLDAAARIFFPRGGARAGLVEVEGRRYRVLLRPDGSPAQLALVDYYEPTREAGDAAPVPCLPRAALRLVETPDGQLDPGSFLPAPRVDWRDVERWEDFTRRCSKRSRNAFKRHQRKMALLDKEVGPTRVSLDEPDHRLLEDALVWKSRQLRRTGHPDRFASPRNRQLLHLLLAEGQLQLAVLFAGERAVAMELGHDDGSCHAAWITAYDIEYSRYSPGVLLFECLMEASWRRGHHHFDFLAGGEPYKLNYATHAWLVGPVGQPSVAQRAACRARAWLTGGPEASRLRAGGFQATRWLLDQRLRRVRMAPLEPEAPWMSRIQQDQPSWPLGRMEDPGVCQLRRLLAQGRRETSPLRTGAARARAEASRSVRSLLDGVRRPVLQSAPQQSPKLEPGDVVRVRTRAEIEATLEDGRAEGIPYEPGQMARHAGRRVTVARRVTRRYDEVRDAMVEAEGLLLEGIRCDGSRHAEVGGCDLACALRWSPAWLEGEEEPATPRAEGAAACGAPFRPGDRVRIRRAEDIARVGDADGVSFVPALMGDFCGEILTVRGRAWRGWDALHRVSFELHGAYQLEGARCPGALLVGGGRCDRGCTLLWREEWLEGPDEGADRPAEARPPSRGIPYG